MPLPHALYESGQEAVRVVDAPSDLGGGILGKVAVVLNPLTIYANGPSGWQPPIERKRRGCWGARTDTPTDTTTRSVLDTTATRDLEALERDYLKRKAEIRSDETLSYEKKELAVRRLGLEYDRRRKEAEGASEVLEDLLRYFKCEDDIRGMRRLVPASSEAQENTSEAAPEQSVTVWGPMSTRTLTDGPPRGDLESTLRYLASLGPATVVGEDAEGAA